MECYLTLEFLNKSFILLLLKEPLYFNEYLFDFFSIFYYYC